MSEGFKKILADVNRLEISARIELFVLDATDIGGGILRFHAGTDKRTVPIVFQGNTYTPIPVSATGFEFRGKGELPRPKISFANVSGAFTSLVLSYRDLLGAKLIRKQTFSRYLDDQPDADSTAEFPEETFTIERKANENKLVVEFELGTPLDVDGVDLPMRQISALVCPWVYRSGECSFAQNIVVADILNNPLGQIAQHYRGLWQAKDAGGVDISYVLNDVVYLLSSGFKQFYILSVSQAVGAASLPPNPLIWKSDQCSKRLIGCKLRFDPLKVNKPLPYGGMPSSERLPEI